MLKNIYLKALTCNDILHIPQLPPPLDILLYPTTTTFGCTNFWPERLSQVGRWCRLFLVMNEDVSKYMWVWKRKRYIQLLYADWITIYWPLKSPSAKQILQYLPCMLSTKNRISIILHFNSHLINYVVGIIRITFKCVIVINMNIITQHKLSFRALFRKQSMKKCTKRYSHPRRTTITTSR